MLQHHASSEYSEEKSNKKYSDLNKSLANLAMKRIAGRSCSEVDAMNAYFPDNNRSDMISKYHKNQDYYYTSSHLYSNKPPAQLSHLHAEIETPEPKRMDDLHGVEEVSNFNPLNTPFDDQSVKEISILSSNSASNKKKVYSNRLATQQSHNNKLGQRVYHHHHHNTSLSKYQQKMESMYPNFIINEVNSPYFHRNEVQNLSQYFKDNSISSIGSGRQRVGSQFSGITDEFKALDAHNVTSIHSRNNLSQGQSQSKKGTMKATPPGKLPSQNPIKNTTVNVRGHHQMLAASHKGSAAAKHSKKNSTLQPHFIYDMHERIARHTKETVDQRQDHLWRHTEPVAAIEEEEEKNAVIDQKLHLQYIGSFRVKTEENCGNLSAYEKLAKRDVSDRCRIQSRRSWNRK